MTKAHFESRMLALSRVETVDRILRTSVFSKSQEKYVKEWKLEYDPFYIHCYHEFRSRSRSMFEDHDPIGTKLWKVLRNQINRQNRIVHLVGWLVLVLKIGFNIQVLCEIFSFHMVSNAIASLILHHIIQVYLVLCIQWCFCLFGDNSIKVVYTA